MLSRPLGQARGGAQVCSAGRQARVSARLAWCQRCQGNQQRIRAEVLSRCGAPRPAWRLSRSVGRSAREARRQQPLASRPIDKDPRRLPPCRPPWPVPNGRRGAQRALMSLRLHAPLVNEKRKITWQYMIHTYTFRLIIIDKRLTLGMNEWYKLKLNILVRISTLYILLSILYINNSNWNYIYIY